MNERRHNRTSLPVNHLAHLIDKTIRNRIMSTEYYEKPWLNMLFVKMRFCHCANAQVAQSLYCSNFG